MNIRVSKHLAESALMGAAVLALAAAFLPPSPPDWAALWSTVTALPWGGPVWLLLRAALTLGEAFF